MVVGTRESERESERERERARERARGGEGGRERERAGEGVEKSRKGIEKVRGRIRLVFRSHICKVPGALSIHSCLSGTVLLRCRRRHPVLPLSLSLFSFPCFSASASHDEPAPQCIARCINSGHAAYRKKRSARKGDRAASARSYFV